VKVVCINNDKHPNILTVGEIYTFHIGKYRTWISFVGKTFILEQGIGLVGYDKDSFISLGNYREQQLNKILG
jgi:hypothetical protein